MAQAFDGKLEKLDHFRWKIPQTYKPGMRVPGLIYASESLLPGILNDKALEQVANVAFLPGIVKYSLAMPDIHWGYGFSIGGVAATDPDNGGVISPGGVGYDINCGVRLVRSDLMLDDLKPRLETLVNSLFNNVPSGVGSSGDIRASAKDEEEIFSLRLIKVSLITLIESFGNIKYLKVSKSKTFKSLACIVTT